MLQKIRFPQTSRGWQWYQHITGGIYGILLMVTGVSFGKGDVLAGSMLAILTFIISRLSSEISYRTSVCVVKEYSKK